MRAVQVIEEMATVERTASLAVVAAAAMVNLVCRRPTLDALKEVRETVAVSCLTAPSRQIYANWASGARARNEVMAKWSNGKASPEKRRHSRCSTVYGTQVQGVQGVQGEWGVD